MQGGPCPCGGIFYTGANRGPRRRKLTPAAFGSGYRRGLCPCKGSIFIPAQKTARSAWPHPDGAPAPARKSRKLRPENRKSGAALTGSRPAARCLQFFGRTGLTIPAGCAILLKHPNEGREDIAGWSSLVARRAHNPKVVWFKSRLRNQCFSLSFCKREHMAA